MNPATFNFLIALFESISEDTHASTSTKEIVLNAMTNIIDNYEQAIS